MDKSGRGRPPWWRSPRAGDGNRATVPLAWPLVRSIALEVIRNGGKARAALAGFLRLPGCFPAVVAGQHPTPRNALYTRFFGNGCRRDPRAGEKTKSLPSGPRHI